MMLGREARLDIHSGYVYTISKMMFLQIMRLKAVFDECPLFLMRKDGSRDKKHLFSLVSFVAKHSTVY